MQTMKTPAFFERPDLKKIIKKVKYRLIPLIVLMFALAMLDRSNVGFVKHYIEVDTGISATAYALGAGIFFIGYALFEVPSNMILHKVGARFWLSRIMVTWGVVSVCMIFVRDPFSFYILRFLLGVAEAGFTPCTINIHCQFLKPMVKLDSKSQPEKGPPNINAISTPK